VAAISFIGERVAEFKGKKQKFYLFNVVYKNEEEGTKESYLGIAGPYSPAGKEIVTYADASAVFTRMSNGKKRKPTNCSGFTYRNIPK
jgi:hypothetical protein